jgi:HK97 family phage prohead protease
MSEIVSRTLEIAGLEVREDKDGHHLVGVVAPFSSTYDAGNYIEQFSSSVFDKSIAERGAKIPLLESHDRGRNPIGMSATWEKNNDGLVGDFRLARTARGEEARQLALDGMVTGFSVGFRPIRSNTQTRDGRKYITRIEGYLDHVGFLNNPAYEEAQLVSVRGYDPDDPEVAPRLARWRHYMKENR